MATWQVQEAKSRLSELIDVADTEGPQVITKHGSEKAVVLSISDYRSLTGSQENLRNYLLGGSKVERFDIRRSRDTGRKVSL